MKDIKNKKISILGAARSGISAAKLAQKFGAIPFISDIKEKKDVVNTLKEHNIDFEFGAHSSKVYDCDILITSPGISEESEVMMNAKKRNLLIVSEIEFASWFTQKPIVAITGTNGKSTTTALTAFIFKNTGINTVAAGNIGLAFSESLLDIESYDLHILEVSSFQIDRIIDFSPSVATILNITPDHLDRYHNSFDEYIDSKYKLLKNMKENALFIKNIDDEIVGKKSIAEKCKVMEFSLNKKVDNGCYFNDGKIFFVENGNEQEVVKKEELFIKGGHNIANAMAAILICKYFNLSNETVKNGLMKFKGLEHRCEFVREINGIKFINDSKATNVNSTYFALNSYDEPIVLILGGREYNNDYSLILDSVKKNVKLIIAIGEGKNKIINFFKDEMKVIPVEKFDDAIFKCYESAVKGDIVLFSPACKSFDMFNNYEHRGEEFKRIVGELK